MRGQDDPQAPVSFRRTFSFGGQKPDDAVAGVVPGTSRRWAWHWRPPVQDGERDLEPAPYYEGLTGRPDPHRTFFIKARRSLNLLMWVLTLGIPTFLVAVGVATGQSLETVFFMGLFGLIVGAMIRASRPRTMFD